MKLIIEIDLDNDATQDREEVRRIIHRAADFADVMGVGFPSAPLHDINGNTIGEIKIEDNSP